MDLIFFIKGLIIGFSVAAPVGPIGILCIRRTLQFGRWSGFFSGLGAALADTLYGIIAAFGLTLISNVLVAYKSALHIGGGLFLIYLGFKTCFASAIEPSNRVTHKTLISDFVSTFFLTLTNPLTILSYLAIFAGFGLSEIEADFCTAGLLVMGVFLGSAIWWFILSEGVTFFRKKMSQKVMKWVNRCAGALIVLFGLTALICSL